MRLRSLRVASTDTTSQSHAPAHTLCSITKCLPSTLPLPRPLPRPDALWCFFDRRCLPVEGRCPQILRPLLPRRHTAEDLVLSLCNSVCSISFWSLIKSICSHTSFISILLVLSMSSTETVSFGSSSSLSQWNSYSSNPGNLRCRVGVAYKGTVRFLSPWAVNKCERPSKRPISCKFPGGPVSLILPLLTRKILDFLRSLLAAFWVLLCDWLALTLEARELIFSAALAFAAGNLGLPWKSHIDTRVFRLFVGVKNLLSPSIRPLGFPMTFPEAFKAPLSLRIELFSRESQGFFPFVTEVARGRRWWSEWTELQLWLAKMEPCTVVVPVRAMLLLQGVVPLVVARSKSLLLPEMCRIPFTSSRFLLRGLWGRSAGGASRHAYCLHDTQTPINHNVNTTKPAALSTNASKYLPLKQN